ncbi:phage major capsid protein, partial [Staphylococcus aureus]
VINGHATNISADQLIGLMYSLPAAYRNNGSWLMNGTTLGKVRTIKDGQGNYLWQPSYQAGQPSTLLGRPVIEDPT